MRMWMVDPATMCRNHLLGEHREIHTLVGAIQSDEIEIDGWLDDGFVDPWRIEKRHRELVAEFDRRGWPSGADHQTPIPDLDVSQYPAVFIPPQYEELADRCDECRRRQEGNDGR